MCTEGSITMKSSTMAQVEGTFHGLNGNVIEVAGEPGDNQMLASEGTGERVADKVQERFSQFSKVLGK